MVAVVAKLPSKLHPAAATGHRSAYSVPLAMTYMARHMGDIDDRAIALRVPPTVCHRGRHLLAAARGLFLGLCRLWHVATDPGASGRCVDLPLEASLLLPILAYTTDMRGNTGPDQDAR